MTVISCSLARFRVVGASYCTGWKNVNPVGQICNATATAMLATGGGTIAPPLSRAGLAYASNPKNRVTFSTGRRRDTTELAIKLSSGQPSATQVRIT